MSSSHYSMLLQFCGFSFPFFFWFRAETLHLSFNIGTSIRCWISLLKYLPCWFLFFFFSLLCILLVLSVSAIGWKTGSRFQSEPRIGAGIIGTLLYRVYEYYFIVHLVLWRGGKTEPLKFVVCVFVCGCLNDLYRNKLSFAVVFFCLRLMNY